MDGLYEEILAAIRLIGLPEGTFRPVPPSEAEPIVRQVEQRYVREPGRRWWWEAFRCRAYAVAFTDQRGFRRLTEVVPAPKEPVWLIANVDEDSPGPVLAFEGSIDAIQAVIGQCYAFEYYVVARRYEWLICETHHNLVIAQGYKAMKRLRAYAMRHPEDVWQARPYPNTR